MDPSSLPIDLIADTNGFDLVVSYKDRGGVLYRDRLAGKFEAVPVDTLPANAGKLVARLVTVSGLGHAWSGGDSKFPYNDAHAPDATTLIGTFARDALA